MTSYIAKRLIGVSINIVIVSVLIFFALRLVPGDVTLTILTESSTEEQREAFRAQHGLDRGPVQQYLMWAGGAITGDFGNSFRSNIAVMDEFKRRLPITLQVVLLSFFFTSVIGVSGGILAAVKQDHFWDYGARFVAILGVSIPNFLLLTILLIIPARYFGYAPPFGSVYIFEDPLRNLQLFIPPALLLAVASSASLMRLTRTSMLDVLRQDYLRTARMKGLAERAVLMKHAVRNALLPVLTLMGIQLNALLGGSIIVEAVMGYPGLGTWALTAIQSKDFPVLMAFSLYAAFTLMMMTLIVDLIYAMLDPRIKYS